MSQRETVGRSPITPVYTQQGPNTPIDLGNHNVRVHLGDHCWDSVAQITMTFLPDQGIRLRVPFNQNEPNAAFQVFASTVWDGGIVLTDRNVEFEVLVASWGGDFNGVELIPTRSVVATSPPAKELTSATFHLFNIPNMYGPDDVIVARDNGWWLCSRTILRAQGWHLEIAAFDRTNDLNKQLKAQGGFVLTHVGTITREDAAAFSSEELTTILSALYYFLSFSLGRWIGVGFPVAAGTDGTCSFEEWGLCAINSGQWNGMSWFDSHHAELLSEVFPGFLKLWTSDLWKQPLREAMYFYVAANCRGVGIGVDTGLVLAQSSLERLAWTYCVCDRKMVSKEAFQSRGLSASNKLRLLITSLQIPTSIPVELTALTAASAAQRGKKQQDGPDAITSIRNEIVHPEASGEVSHECFVESWNLALWYIDVVFLRLCGHSGKYGNRLSQRWTGSIEDMPSL